MEFRILTQQFSQNGPGSPGGGSPGAAKGVPKVGSSSVITQTLREDPPMETAPPPPPARTQAAEKGQKASSPRNGSGSSNEHCFDETRARGLSRVCVRKQEARLPQRGAFAPSGEALG